MAAETGTCTPEGLKISRRPLSLIRERRRQNSPPGATSSLETTVVGDDSADVFRGVGSRELIDMIEWFVVLATTISVQKISHDGEIKSSTTRYLD